MESIWFGFTHLLTEEEEFTFTRMKDEKDEYVVMVSDLWSIEQRIPFKTDHIATHCGSDMYVCISILAPFSIRC